jgi:hypothetical protein
MPEVIIAKNTSSRLLYGLTVTPLVVLARIFHELLSRDHETGNPLAGLSGAQRARRKWVCHLATRPAVPRDWFRGVPERYVAGADTLGRQEGRPYPWLQQVIHETSGLALGLHWVLEFPADREPQEVLYGRERANIE